MFNMKAEKEDIHVQWVKAIKIVIVEKRKIYVCSTMVAVYGLNE